ncbi:MAG: hypothetical protein ABEI06_10110 [Halobacteriaceae archaeon]
MTYAQVGELIVGAYLRVINECTFVSYNQQSIEQGKALDIDILGIESTKDGQVIFACIVSTHLHGTHYSGTPTTDKWNDYGNDAYQYTLERIWKTFRDDYNQITTMFPNADQYILQFWSPIVPVGLLTTGLEDLKQQFEQNYGGQIDLVINEEYTQRIRELQHQAARTKQRYGEPAFRLLQILEHIRDHTPDQEIPSEESDKTTEKEQTYYSVQDF